MKTYTVYALISPETNTPFYVGVTGNMKQRIWEHYGCKQRNAKQKNEYILSLKEKGYKPLFSILEQDIISKTGAEVIESNYITKYKLLGYVLFNRNEGGNKPPSNKGKVFTETEKRNRFLISPLKKTVIQLTKKGEFVNEFLGVREACRITGIDHRSIAQVAAGSKIRKSAGGYKWEYKE